jgi:hypothetical protein
MPLTHRIRITSADHGYVTVGAVALKCATNPMRCAAVALLEAGADRADKLRGVFEGAQISPMTLASIVRIRHSPRSDLPANVLNAH